MKRPKIGDIIEISITNGLFYAQYTHKHDKYGELIQITKKSFKKRPKIEEIINSNIGIITFIPLYRAYKDIEFESIGNFDIPKSRLAFPVFRVRGNVDRKGNVKNWKFWDGENIWPEKYISKLKPEEYKLPILGVWNKEMLFKRLQEGWLPENHGKSKS